MWKTPPTRLPDPSIEEIVAEIGERFRPSRIVLFGSRTRGDATADSDHDLYVEAASCDTSMDELHDQILALLRQRDPTVRLIVDLIVTPKGQIERRRDDPGTLEWDVAREGVALYADGMSVRSRVAPGVIREPSPGRCHSPRPRRERRSPRPSGSLRSCELHVDDARGG